MGRRERHPGHRRRPLLHVDTAKPAQILHFSNTGAALGGTIAGPGRDWIPTALAIDHQGNLLVGDNGPHRQVYTYANLSGTPTLARTLGQRGGIGSGTPGLVTPQKLFGIVGVGADQAGNVYVGMHEYGTVLRAFDPAGKLVWELIGRGFVDSADFDPASDGADVHSKQNHYRIDHGKPAGSDATWVGYSLDSVRYPQDPRLFLPAQHHHATSPFLLRRNGSLYMYLTGMYSYHLVVYKFDGEIARPAGMFAKSRWAGDEPAWPPNQPASGEWIWRDTNGNGAFEAGEYSQPATVANAPSGWVWHVDTNADVWQGGDRLLRRFPLQGYDSHANPVYTYASAVSYALPAPFTKVMRLHYDPATDVMYLSGYTAAAPYDNAHWKELGRVLARYDRWKTGNRTATWTVDLPWDVTSDPMVTMVGLAVAGEYLFTVGIATRGQVWVWKQSDGSAVGTWQPGANVGGVERTGWVDIPYGVTAMRRSNGDYLVNVEDDLLNKVLLYRWRP
ncbi:hypothetical protein [Actinocatenispora rupis]|uniref:NHL repeat-containing protein n=1 Tax=Actinocatenispora rupis TaxID=519421 RepID=A0A8J3J3E3_9ACTN|nr:hypothetical protein [Actinocatenispora rupis]GID10876.1 hypothetical protein Aru02nite_17650 [Actinocatenispora rupis]